MSGSRICAAGRRNRCRGPRSKTNLPTTSLTAAGRRRRQAPPSRSHARCGPRRALTLAPCASRRSGGNRPGPDLGQPLQQSDPDAVCAGVASGSVLIVRTRALDGVPRQLPAPRRRRRASLAVVLVAVERVALAEAGGRPYLAALAILSGQEFADLADGAFVGRGAPAAVFAVFGGVEILIALAMIRPHPSAPGALGRNQCAVLGLRLGTLGGHQVQALALIALIAIVTAVAVAAVIVPVAAVIVPVTAVIVPVTAFPLAPALLAVGNDRPPLDHVARVDAFGRGVMEARLQVGFAAPARIGEAKTAVVVVAIAAQRLADVVGGVGALGKSRHRLHQEQQHRPREQAQGAGRDVWWYLHVTPYDDKIWQGA